MVLLSDDGEGACPTMYSKAFCLGVGSWQNMETHAGSAMHVENMVSMCVDPRTGRGEKAMREMSAATTVCMAVFFYARRGVK